MDKMLDSGSDDGGSSPFGRTTTTISDISEQLKIYQILLQTIQFYGG